jgi:hypothetical protein
MEIREITKTPDDLFYILVLYKNHPVEWDCTYEEFKRLFSNIFYNKNSRCWMASIDGKPVGFMLAYLNQGFVNQVDVVATYIEPGGIFKECIAGLGKNVMDWAVKEKVKRITWNTSANIDAWVRHISGLSNDIFQVKGIKQITSLIWEATDGGK